MPNTHTIPRLLGWPTPYLVGPMARLRRHGAPHRSCKIGSPSNKRGEPRDVERALGLSPSPRCVRKPRRIRSAFVRGHHSRVRKPPGPDGRWHNTGEPGFARRGLKHHRPFDAHQRLHRCTGRLVQRGLKRPGRVQEPARRARCVGPGISPRYRRSNLDVDSPTGRRVLRHIP